MSETLTSSMPGSDTEDETILRQISIEIDSLNGRMAQDRRDIERLKSDTDLLKEVLRKKHQEETQGHSGRD